MKSARIYTVTPNPALDVSGQVERLLANEKNYVFAERRDPGGNGINAARIATRLKAKVLAMGLLGGTTGSEISSLLDREKVNHHFQPIRENNRTNITVTNLETGKQTRLTFPGPKVRRSEARALIRQTSSLNAPGIFIIGGSLPEGATQDLHLDLARAATRSGLGVVIDVPSIILKQMIGDPRIQPLLVKPNQVELEEWFGRSLRSDRAIIKAAQEMAKSVSLVVVSLGARGALLVHGKKAWFAAAPKIQARSTVGAGDSMVGAMCTVLARHHLIRPEEVNEFIHTHEKEKNSRAQSLASPLGEMLTLGVAAGAGTAQVSGTQLADPKVIRSLIRKVRIRPL